MKKIGTRAALATVCVLAALSAFSADTKVLSTSDEQSLVAIIKAIEHGWENADGQDFRSHFLDFDGARYIESGGQNEGLADLIGHHVEPEGDALANFDLNFSDVETHVEGDFAWAIANVELTATVRRDGRQIHNRGYETFLFRRVGGDWKVVHTHSSSRPVNKD